VILTLVIVDIADHAGASGQRLWMIAAGLFIFALAQSGGFFMPWTTGCWDEWSRQLVPSVSQPQL
jgi:hypothetical protein